MNSILFQVFLLSQFCTLNPSKDSIYLGEIFQIEISYSHPRNCSVTVSGDSAEWHPFIMNEAPAKSLLTNGEDSLSTVFTLSGAVYTEIDSVSIPIPPAKFHLPDTSWTDSLRALDITMLSSLTGPDDTVLSPLRPRLDFPPKPPEPLYKRLFRMTLRFWYIPLLIISIILIASTAYLLIKKSAKKGLFVLSPKEKAMDELSKIFNSYLKEKSPVSKEFYEELTEVFKDYSENVSTLKTKKMTVREIRDVFLKSFYVSKDVEKSLSSFNTTSELAKFSKITFDSEKGQEDYEAVKNFVWVFPLFKKDENDKKGGENV